MAIIIYTTSFCPYCDRAKLLLSSKKVSYQTIDITDDPKERQLLLEKSNGLRTVPQIFISDKHIGGFDDLRKLELQGRLDHLIEQYKVKAP